MEDVHRDQPGGEPQAGGGQGIRRPAQQGEGGAPQEDDEELKE